MAGILIDAMTSGGGGGRPAPWRLTFNSPFWPTHPPVRYRIARRAGGTWVVIDRYATSWSDYLIAEFPTGAEAIAAFAAGGR